MTFPFSLSDQPMPPAAPGWQKEIWPARPPEPTRAPDPVIFPAEPHAPPVQYPSTPMTP
jgi:hypothetical protein